MVSQEMLSLGTNSSVIREIFEYSMLRSGQIGAENVFDFSLGNPSIPTPKAVTETMQKLLAEHDPVLLHGYTSGAGDMDVRRKLAANILNRFAFAADPALMYMTCGAAASLSITLKALLNPGDEVLLLAPFFPEYTVFVKNAGGIPVIVPCETADMSPDLAKLTGAITPNTRAVILNFPNNPTGAVITKAQLTELASVLKEKSQQYGRSITILADEPYRELVYDGTEVPYIPCYYDDTVVCYSYSKSLSLPGERIGYIMVSPKAPYAGNVYAAICGAGRSMGYVCAPSLLQLTVAACDGTTPDLSAYDRNRTLLYNSLTEIGYEAVKPQGAFYLFVKALEEDANTFCETAKKYELLLVPSDDFGITGYVRLAYCVSYDRIQRSIPAFQKLYDHYKGESR